MPYFEQLLTGVVGSVTCVGTAVSSRSNVRRILSTYPWRSWPVSADVDSAALRMWVAGDSLDQQSRPYRRVITRKCEPRSKQLNRPLASYHDYVEYAAHEMFAQQQYMIAYSALDSFYGYRRHIGA